MIGGFVVLVAAFMLLRTLGVGPFGSLLSSGRIKTKAPILVTDLTVKGGDSTLGGVVATGLRASLAQSNVITLVSPQTVAAALARAQLPPGTRMDLALARNIAAREGFRRESVITPVADGVIAGFGFASYTLALRAVAGLLENSP